MTYVALLYSPKLDQFETDCNNFIWTDYDIAEWIQNLSKHYNDYFGIDDFYIMSITKIGE